MRTDRVTFMLIWTNNNDMVAIIFICVALSFGGAVCVYNDMRNEIEYYNNKQ